MNVTKMLVAGLLLLLAIVFICPWDMLAEPAAEKEAGLSQVLVADLGGYRQQILKAAVAADPGTALDLVLHAMVCGLFSTGWARTPFSATFEKTQETVSASDLDDTVAGAELKALAEALPFIANRPSDPVELFDAGFHIV